MSKQARNSNDPYRVIIWGPGGIGRGCLREIVKRPEFKLVGMLCYSESKVGKDAGELIGHAPLGVTLTNDKEAIYAMEADVVIWSGRPAFDPEAMDTEVLRLLESGKNVVTPAAYHYPPKHGRAYVDKIEAACRKGGSSLYGTGENPGYWFERMAPTLTGLCTSVESIFLDEYADCGASGTSAETLYGVGFGMTVEEAEITAKHLRRMWTEFYYVESMEMIAQSTWGRPVERWDVQTGHYLADRDIVLDEAKGDPISMTIPKGRTSGIIHTFTGFIDGQPRVKTRVNWCLRPENSPFPYKAGDVWKIEIEGKPVSLRCQFDAFASLKGETEFQPGEQISMAWYATIVPMIQAIPILVGAEPGIVVPSVFANCVPDFRQLEKRKSLVDQHHYKE